MNEVLNDVTNNEEPKIINTGENSIIGQDKCPKCGATDISHNMNTGNLRCNYCRYEFKPVIVEELNTEVSELNGEIITSGAQNIQSDSKDMMTLKCSSCGAEVVIDTTEVLQARCHWCRNTLSINQQIPNGSVPDVVLPFGIRKEDARVEIEKFVNKRRFFAHPIFKKEFTTENIMGVYLPYMVVDVNAHSTLVGQGEILVRQYTRGSKENRQTYYDADLYEVGRDFDIQIDNLTVESNSEKLERGNNKTNNVINAILPFDIENCVKYNSNYLKGYTSERRNTNIEDLKLHVETQAKDIARFKTNETIEEYNRGVRWDNEKLEVKGQRWQTAYLPIWLYSYQQKRGEKSVLHYVAVNARTKETMGSVPINQFKLLLCSAIVEVFCFMAMLFVDFDYEFIFLLGGILFYMLFYAKYRNHNARHNHEIETKANMQNIKKLDKYVKLEKGLTNSRIKGANNLAVNGSKFVKKEK